MALTSRRTPLRAAAPAPDQGTDTTLAVSSAAARDLTESAVDVAATPWGDVEVPRTSVTVAHLLRDGWHPIPDGARRPGPTITMSGAGVA